MYKINTNTKNNYNKFDNTNKTNKFDNTNKNRIDNFTNCVLDNDTYKQNNIINEDTKKMHLLPPHCPMTPKTYTDFFNDNTVLEKPTPYKMNTVKHPKEGYKHTIEYRHFYNDFKKDALHYTDNNYAFIDNTNNKNTKNNSNNNNNNTNNKNIKLTINDDENVKLYSETKNKNYNNFATPMKINGSNKIEDLFDNCMNKKTFEYERFSKISPHNKQWVDNSLFHNDISEETQTLKNKFIDNRDTNTMDIYSDVFKDMYAMTYNPIEYTQSALINRINREIKNEQK
jgi:hypothetical protein